MKCLLCIQLIRVYITLVYLWRLGIFTLFYDHWLTTLDDNGKKSIGVFCIFVIYREMNLPWTVLQEEEVIVYHCINSLMWRFVNKSRQIRPLVEENIEIRRVLILLVITRNEIKKYMYVWTIKMTNSRPFFLRIVSACFFGGGFVFACLFVFWKLIHTLYPTLTSVPTANNQIEPL